MFWSKKSTSGSNVNAKPEDILHSFVKKAPSAKYTFDSERDAPEAELCRQPNGELSKECIVIHMNSKRLFEAMQDLGFFCALPLNPGKTHMECVPIPK